MSRFDFAVERVLEHLSGDPTLKGLRFSPAYPSSSRPSPLAGIFCAVGLSSVELIGGALGGYIGNLPGGGECFGSRADVCVSILIHSPPSLGACGCSEAFSRICSSLTDGSLGGVVSVNGGQVGFDSTSGAFQMACSVRMRGYWGQDSGGGPIRHITVKGGGA